jgi:hypothetical protein
VFTSNSVYQIIPITFEAVTEDPTAGELEFFGGNYLEVMAYAISDKFTHRGFSTSRPVLKTGMPPRT